MNYFRTVERYVLRCTLMGQGVCCFGTVEM